MEGVDGKGAGDVEVKEEGVKGVDVEDVKERDEGKRDSGYGSIASVLGIATGTVTDTRTDASNAYEREAEAPSTGPGDLDVTLDTIPPLTPSDMNFDTPRVGCGQFSMMDPGTDTSALGETWQVQSPVRVGPPPASKPNNTDKAKAKKKSKRGHGVRRASMGVASALPQLTNITNLELASTSASANSKRSSTGNISINSQSRSTFNTARSSLSASLSNLKPFAMGFAVSMPTMPAVYDTFASFLDFLEPDEGDGFEDGLVDVEKGLVQVDASGLTSTVNR
ncbi:hypothetical protein CVT24_010884 [Panaeolus cyanescens]|uniref:Uncharacterized protein n=1 Tax=Panaeolus cyanescens TaxID=181874 RepID=A0A409YYD1_9AGAR|nr:hypothetical protein CVT24_010884 [Panaeolus cyanescens]